MHACIHTYKRTYMHTFMHAYMHTYINIHTYVYVGLHTYTYIHSCMHTYTYVHKYMHKYIHTYTFIHTCIRTHIHTYIRGCADKSLARPGMKQSTATKLGIYSTYSPRSSIHFLVPCSNFCKPLKKIRKLSVQLGICGSNDLCVGRKMANFQLFF